MNNGAYSAASGLVAAQQRLELIANNLANVATGGYRAQRPFAETFRAASAEAALGRANAATVLGGAYDVPGQGPLRPTGRPLDVALPDGALLVVDTGVGRGYTREGSLHVDDAGRLTDAQGRPVLDPQGQPIEGLGPGARIAADGQVLVGEAALGSLGLVRDDPATLLRGRDGLRFLAVGAPAPAPATEPRLETASLEGSSTDPLGELVSMIEAQRAFESLQKVISMTMNEVNRRAVNDLAG